MTVTQFLAALAQLPGDAVVLMAGDGGLSLVGAIDFVEAAGPGAPAEVLLLPSVDE